MMNKNTMEKTVCFAYFVDGRFVVGIQILLDL